MDTPRDPTEAERLVASIAHRAPHGSWGDVVQMLASTLGVDAEDLAEGHLLGLLHDASSTMPIGDVAEVKWDTKSKPPRVVVRSRMFGLTGAVSPLPSALGELLGDPSDEDEVLRRLLDILHHQLLVTLWTMVAPACGPRQSVSARRLASMAGMLDEGERISSAAASAAADHTAARPVAATAFAMQSILQRPLAPMAPQVLAFAPHRTPVPQDEQVTLGSDLAILGVDSVCSSERTSATSLLLVELGHVGAQDLLSLLPGGARHRKLSDWAAWMLPPTTEVQLRMSVAADDLPAPVLDGGVGSCLGFDTVCTLPGAAPQRVHVMLGSERAEWSIEGEV